MSSEKLAEALDAIHKKHLPIHSLLVIRNGYVILDATFFPYDGVTPHDVASCTKSVTTTLVGIAIQDGKINSVHDRVLDYFSNSQILNSDQRKRRLTIFDLLTMRSGLQCVYKGGEPTLREMRASPDWTRFMLDRPMADEPGKTFVYCSGGMHLLSSLVTHTTGLSTAQYAQQRLFGPLGIAKYIWPADAQGVNAGWGDLHLLPRDLAKIGLLYLHNGVWDGKRILPTDFAADATLPITKTPFADDYGYGWFISPSQRQNEFMAIGRGGQRMTVLRKFNSIVVTMGEGTWDPGNDVNPLLGRALVSDHALPENPIAFARLQAAILKSSDSPQPRPVGIMPVAAKTISGTVYEVQQNPLGLETIRLDFGADRATLWLSFQGGRKERHGIGLDGVFQVTPGGFLDLPVAVRGKWESPEAFLLEYDSIANINSYTLLMKFKGSNLQIEGTEASGAAKQVLEGHAALPTKDP